MQLQGCAAPGSVAGVVACGMEMILMDAEGGRIQAPVKDCLVQVFDYRLVEGETYVMKSYAVIPNDGSSRMTKHGFKLILVDKTVIVSADDGKVVTENIIHASKIVVSPDSSEAKQYANIFQQHGVELFKSMECIVGHLDFVVVAIVEENWSYDCRCEEHLAEDYGSYYCISYSKEVEFVIPRYSVKVEVYNGDESAVFVIYGANFEILVSTPCDQMIKSYENQEPRHYPEEFEKLVGQELLFKLMFPPSFIEINDFEDDDSIDISRGHSQDKVQSLHVKTPGAKNGCNFPG
ncbi:Nucleic acid-binding, OB-fold [Sesbania bispinosa]|nr:Nucleic acid-binding, OB-fold [Sesbania bispinosa]